MLLRFASIIGLSASQPRLARRFIFSDHLLDTERRELRHGADLVAVEPQVFDLLVHLLINCDRVVSKDDLVASIWCGRIVSDSTVTTRINAARKAIGDSGDVQKLIRTIPRKGFRFVGEVCTLIDNGKLAALSLERTHDWKLALPLPDRPAVAVLAFKNVTGDPQHEHFSDGISEDIITALSKLRWFFVIAHNTSFTYKGKTVPLKQIGEELGVGYVIEGSVRKDGDRVRITRSSMTSSRAAKSGPSAMTANSPTCSLSRTRSQTRSLRRSNRSSMPLKTSAPSANRPTAFMRGTW
jgi:TolB-like protein